MKNQYAGKIKTSKKMMILDEGTHFGYAARGDAGT